MNLLSIPGEIPALQPPVLFHIGSWPVTNSLLMIWLILLLTIIFVQTLKRGLSLKPGRLQNMFEVLYEGMLGLVDQITSKREVSEKIFPLIASLLLFIGVSNLITLIPGLTSLTFNGQAIFRAPTTDFNTTFALALSLMLLVQLQSLKDYGIFGYIGKFIQIKPLIQGFRQGLGVGMTALINFLIGLLDIISEIAKVVSLSMRLFGNIFAGAVLMVIIMTGLAYVLPAAWMAMNILSGVVQALVFGALITAYYSLSLKPEE